jgi:hypothetical protein
MDIEMPGAYEWFTNAKAGPANAVAGTRQKQGSEPGISAITPDQP